jgi:methylated-DNA-protein-cysteine methyltransferase related protein
MASETYEKIYAVVRRIPRGKVATYGQIARLAGFPGAARQVGYAMHALPSSTRVPWHRVISAPGQIAKRADPDGARWQRLKLEREGIVVDPAGRISLHRFGWKPRRSSPD